MFIKPNRSQPPRWGHSCAVLRERQNQDGEPSSMLVIAGGINAPYFRYETEPVKSVVVCKIQSGGALADTFCSQTEKELPKKLLGGKCSLFQSIVMMMSSFAVASTVINSGQTWVLLGGKGDTSGDSVEIYTIECFATSLLKVDCDIVLQEKSLRLERSYGLAFTIP